MWCPHGLRHLGGRSRLPSSVTACARTHLRSATAGMLRAEHAGFRCGGDRRAIGTLGQKGLGLLDHQHLSGNGPGGLVDYEVAEAVQDEHRSKFLVYKSLPDHEIATATPPRPRLISFESAPTFTLGRRQDDPDPDQTARLERLLAVDLPRRRGPSVQGEPLQPRVKKTSRGGLTTYHGPGQLVLWPVLDMHSPLHARFGVASYACLLEKTTQRLLRELFGIKTYTNRDEPGVWVADSTAAAAGSQQQQQQQAERKIAAMGVHHRRYVTALGIALNVDVPVAGGEDVNPWARFVPCGLEGKLVTSVAAEAGSEAAGEWSIDELAARWAVMFEEGLANGLKSG